MRGDVLARALDRHAVVARAVDDDRLAGNDRERRLLAGFLVESVVEHRRAILGVMDQERAVAPPDLHRAFGHQLRPARRNVERGTEKDELSYAFRMELGPARRHPAA